MIKIVTRIKFQSCVSGISHLYTRATQCTIFIWTQHVDIYSYGRKLVFDTLQNINMHSYSSRVTFCHSKTHKLTWLWNNSLFVRQLLTNEKYNSASRAILDDGKITLIALLLLITYSTK